MNYLLQFTSSDGALMPRHSALRVGIPIDRPALGINRLCGSGFQAVVSGAQVSEQTQGMQELQTLLAPLACIMFV
jgi:acetyl-CoA acyltransferase 2